MAGHGGLEYHALPEGHQHDESCSHGGSEHGHGHGHGGHGDHEHAGHGYAGHGHAGQEHASAGQKSLLPVTVLTGHRGAGKTTLLNYILSNQKDKKLAVIENEIGEVSIDDSLAEQKHSDLAEELWPYSIGRVLRGDLVKTLKAIAKTSATLDGVLIELAGGADLAPVLQSFFWEEEIAEAFRLDNVVALVDAKHAMEKLEESNDPNKATHSAQIAFSSTVLLNKIDLAGLDQLSKIERRLKEINSTVKILRCKEARVAMAELFQVGAFALGKVLQEQYMDRDEMEKFYKPKMDNSISNFGFHIQGSMRIKWLEHAMASLIDETSVKDIFRIKGVFSIEGQDKKFVVQAVQLKLFSAFTVPWAEGETRESKIVIIGRNIEKRRHAFAMCLQDCIAKPLRFPVGAQVVCRIAPQEWDKGIVTKQFPDELHAYLVHVKSGQAVRAARDNDFMVKEDPEPDFPPEEGAKVAAQILVSHEDVVDDEPIKEWLKKKGLEEVTDRIMEVCTREFLFYLDPSREAAFAKTAGLPPDAAKKLSAALVELRSESASK